MTLDKDRIYLQHILECIFLIQTYTKGSKAVFMANGVVQDAVLRRLQTMAESTQQLSDSLKEKVPEVDWRALSGFRNVLVHDYLNGIDLEKVWDAVENYLPELETAVKTLEDLC